MAQASIGVEIIDPDVKQASDEAARTMEAVLAALKAQGVADEDIQTSYYNIWSSALQSRRHAVYRGHLSRQ
jgi:uncharacterized protein YggE